MAAILVIDDDARVRAILRLMLESSGHQVTEADDGRLGLEAFRNTTFAAVFCDLFMPEKEGLETIQELRQRSATVRIVAMSGGSRYGAPDFLTMAVNLGADRSLHKPIALEMLGEVLKELKLN